MRIDLLTVDHSLKLDQNLDQRNVQSIESLLVRSLKQLIPVFSVFPADIFLPAAYFIELTLLPLAVNLPCFSGYI